MATLSLIFIKMKIGTDSNVERLFYDNFLDVWGIFCQQGLTGFIKIIRFICFIFVFFFLFLFFSFFNNYTLRTKLFAYTLDIPNRSSLKIAYFSIYILAVVLSAAYSAALISYLTSGIRKLPFRSLESFVEDGTYKLSVSRGTAEYDQFAVSISYASWKFYSFENI